MQVQGNLRPHAHRQDSFHQANAQRPLQSTVSAVHLSKRVSIGADSEDADGMVNAFAEEGKAEKAQKTAALSKSETEKQEFVTPSREYSIQLDNHLNVQYSGRFTIGEQELPVIYDTGSFEVLVLSTKCNTCVKTLSMYDYKKSRSFRDSPTHVVAEHEFVSGDVVTAEGFETLRLGKRDSPVSTSDMTFWMVQSHELKFWKTGHAIFSGIVGLSHVKKIPDGFSGDSSQDRSLLEEMHLDAFALCYQRGGIASPGWLQFGPSISAMAHDKGFQSVDVSGDSHWATKLSQFKVDLDGIDTTSLCKPSCGALIDSGTSLLTFPRSASHITDALKQKVKRDCSNLDELPTLYFELDGAEVVLPPRAYIFKVTGTDGLPYCRGAFMKVDKESQFGEVFILGMPFLRYYFTVFDRQNKQVHIARSTEDCKVAPHMSLLATNATASGRSGRHGFASADFLEATPADLDDVVSPPWLNAAGEFIRL
ncbi:PGA [Symbiodinium pilosum]|uniref:PGA protein n=1 Tax=Symbiodinium pilosum TaxID=2952 RepID=A0A812R2Q3_SYMPI|nr:PGA [Symbiodinium pilosum]